MPSANTAKNPTRIRSIYTLSRSAPDAHSQQPHAGKQGSRAYQGSDERLPLEPGRRKPPSAHGGILYLAPNQQIEGVGIQGIDRFERDLRHLGEVDRSERVILGQGIAPGEYGHRASSRRRPHEMIRTDAEECRKH